VSLGQVLERVSLEQVSLGRVSLERVRRQERLAFQEQVLWQE
jgi:hypothetical protein